MQRLLTHKTRSERGFSLLEMTIVVAIIGVFVGSLASVYYNYEVRQKVENTNYNVSNVMNALGNFRAVHGRYPCPSSLTASPGDNEYGHEDANCRAGTFAPPGTCVDGVCAATSVRPTIGTIAIGALPFKSMNLEEDEVYDSYGRKLSYATTAILTNDTTFGMKKGGISVVKEDGTTAINPVDSAHFVIISHGENGFGGYSNGGTISAPCDAAPANEGENCDFDETFVSMKENSNNYDDTTAFFTGVDVSYWQLTEYNSDDIILRGGDNIGVGYEPNYDLSSFTDQALVKQKDSDTGSMWAQDSYVVAQDICNVDATDPSDPSECFKTKLIMGNLETDGQGNPPDGGMACDDTNKYMIGIKNGAPVCTDEIYLSCPTNSIMTGIVTDPESSGLVVQCTKSAGAPCQAKAIQTSCNMNRTLPATLHNKSQSVYSGRCYGFATDYDADYFSDMMDSLMAGGDTFDQAFAQVQAHIENDINTEARVMQNCAQPKKGTNKSALVRDTFTCKQGLWSSFEPDADNKVSSQERRSNDVDFPADRFTAPDPAPAETNGDFTYNVGEDPLNTSENHDCWCREDYRATSSNCGPGFSGTQAVFSKHECPQTTHEWTEILSYRGGCECVDGPRNFRKSCAAYYGVDPDDESISGFVRYKQDYNCTTGQYGPEYDIDTSRCVCPHKDTEYTYDYCPTGTTNDFVFSETGQRLRDVEGIQKREWICPAPNQPGYWGTIEDVTGIPPCVCGDSRIVTEDCADGLTGAGTKYRQPWNCTLMDWEPNRSLWTLISRDCKSCSWRSSGGSDLKSVRLGEKVGSLCACGATPGYCYDDGPDNKYYVWTGCQCVKND